MVPVSATVGDAIFAFVGGQVLYVLRTTGLSTKYNTYIGEAYVHGLMDGEVMAWVQSDVEPIVDLTLVSLMIETIK